MMQALQPRRLLEHARPNRKYHDMNARTVKDKENSNLGQMEDLRLMIVDPLHPLYIVRENPR